MTRIYYETIIKPLSGPNQDRKKEVKGLSYMNCRNCNRPLVQNAAFCPNCGTVVAPANPEWGQVLANTGQPGRSEAAYPPPAATTRPRRRGLGIATGCFAALVIVVLIAIGGWILLVRPYFHQMAQAAVDQALNEAVNQIPPGAAALPPGNVQLKEQLINNFLVLNSSPSGPIQNPNAQILPDGVHVGFKAYNTDNSISFTPISSKNHLVASNVTISGPLSLIMSPDELKAILDNHFADAQARIQHPIQAVTLQNHVINVLLGNPSFTLP